MVTGHNEQGKSIVLIDDMPKNDEIPLDEVWISDETPAENGGNKDSTQRPINLAPHEGRLLFRFCEIPPEGAKLDVNKIPDKVGSTEARMHVLTRRDMKLCTKYGRMTTSCFCLENQQCFLRMMRCQTSSLLNRR